MARPFQNKKAAPAERPIASRILMVRNRKILLDAGLADRCGVTTGALVQAVKRNLRRFPPDFMFLLRKQ